MAAPAAGPVLPLPPLLVDGVLRAALAEDLGRAGDITTNATIPAEARATARIVARGSGVVAGLEAATRVFTLLDPDALVTLHTADGDPVAAGELLATVEGRTRALLTGERTCLNILGHLSGVATATARLVDLVHGTGARIADTRKTIPGLRALQKYAVRCGGGVNHRFGLDDAVLVKDNHIAAVGSLPAAVAAAGAAVGHTVRIEVEVDTLAQLQEALDAGADAVLLDNMTLSELEKAVEIVGGRCVTEASGGITPDTVAAVAATGVDLISVGWLTHSAPQLDVGLDL